MEKDELFDEVYAILDNLAVAIGTANYQRTVYRDALICILNSLSEGTDGTITVSLDKKQAEKVEKAIDEIEKSKGGKS